MYFFSHTPTAFTQSSLPFPKSPVILGIDPVFLAPCTFWRAPFPPTIESTHRQGIKALIMGSGDWLKNIISKKKSKEKTAKNLKVPSEKQNEAKEEKSQKESPIREKCVPNRKQRVAAVLTEDVAATRIQTAFRAFLARKTFRHLKGGLRLQALIQRHSVQKQASSTLTYLHSWSNMQGQIKARRVCMVTEGRLRQKKLENQLKLEAKLHDLEVEWSGGADTFEEVVGRIHQREEAAVKRERALAYAFSHQWRANSNPYFGVGNNEPEKTSWGWSWMDRWIAARPWESRMTNPQSPKKPQSVSKSGKKTNSPKPKTSPSAKSMSPLGKASAKGRKLTYEAAQKVVTPKENVKAEEAGTAKS